MIGEISRAGLNRRQACEKGLQKRSRARLVFETATCVRLQCEQSQIQTARQTACDEDRVGIVEKERGLAAERDWSPAVGSPEEGGVLMAAGTLVSKDP